MRCHEEKRHHANGYVLGIVKNHETSPLQRAHLHTSPNSEKKKCVCDIGAQSESRETSRGEKVVGL